MSVRKCGAVFIACTVVCVHTVSGSFGSMEWGGLCPNDAFSTPLIQ